MSRAFKIRPAQTEDAEAVAQLANALARELGGHGDAMDAGKVTRDMLAGAFGLDVLVAELGGVVVGYLLHHIGYESSHGARGRYVSDIYVATGARRRGIASALLARAAKITREEGGTFLWWLGKTQSAESRALYAKFSSIKQPVTAYASAFDKFEALVQLDDDT